MLMEPKINPVSWDDIRVFIRRIRSLVIFISLVSAVPRVARAGEAMQEDDALRHIAIVVS